MSPLEGYSIMAFVHQSTIVWITTECFKSIILSWGRKREGHCLRDGGMIVIVVIRKNSSLGIFLNLVILQFGKWQAWRKLGLRRRSLFTGACSLISILENSGGNKDNPFFLCCNENSMVVSVKHGCYFSISDMYAHPMYTYWAFPQLVYTI